jgi:hypothetical protein
VIVFAVADESLSPTSPLSDAIDTFTRREDAERFIASVQRDDPKLAARLRVVERELEMFTRGIVASSASTTRRSPRLSCGRHRGRFAEST